MSHCHRRRQTLLPGWDDAAGRTSPSSADQPPAASNESEARSGSTPSALPLRPSPQPSPAAADCDPRARAAAEPAGAAAPAEEPDSLAGKTVYVIDANSLIFQVFHAIPEMTSPRGEPVNALFGFTRDVLYLLQQKRPDYLFCAFDMPGPTFRHELYPDYKVHRAEMPDELMPQIPAIQRMMEALGVPRLELPSYEADDILATVARRTVELGGRCFLVTTDKDCRQLISDQVVLYNVRKDEVYDAESLWADWGVRPEQVVDFQALVGDPVDHVPGVPLVGPKVASELLARFGTLEGVLAGADQVSGAKRRQNLIEHRQQALLSRQLVRLDDHVPVAIPWQAARTDVLHADRALALCTEFGFHRIADQIRAMGAASAAADAPAWQADYRAVDTPQRFERLLAELAGQRSLSIDLETTSIAPSRADIVGYAIAWLPGSAVYLPVRAPAGQSRLDPEPTLAALKPLLEDAQVKKIGQNLKYEMVVLRRAGVNLAGAAFDTMVASYLLEAGERNHNLDELALRYLNHRNIPISDLIGSGRQQKRMDEVPVAQVVQYAGEDADVPLRLMPILGARLDEAGLRKLFDEVEMPLVEVLAELESNGVRLDVPFLRSLSQRYGRRLAQLEAEIHALAGHPFNIASPRQLAQVLFAELGLPVIARTKTGPSTDADVLEELAQRHPLPARIIEYRQFAKLKSTYVDALPEMVNPDTGRVHASFHQAVAATGRLSSSDPNLQNIPIRTEEGREIRAAFLPGRDDWLLLAADYSQIELRVLAHYSRDETLCQAFHRDEDIHALVAAQVYGVPPEEVTGSMRRNAKAVNFGVIYGQSPFGLARALGIEQDEAAAFIEGYFARYPGVDRFLTKVLEEARNKGYVSTILGRRRAIRGVRPGSSRQRNLPERTAINTVIQGSAADLIKLAMIAVFGRLRRERRAARMLLQIHDELVFEVPPDELEPVATLVREEMGQVLPLAVPLKVDIKTGKNWAETEAMP